MDKEYTHIDRIDSYYNGEMNSSNKESFEEELKSNPVLKSEFDLYSTAQQLLLLNEMMLLKNQMKQDMKNPETSTGNNTSGGGSNGSKYIIVAAALLLLGGLAWFMSTNSSEKQTSGSVANKEITESGTENKTEINTSENSSNIESIDKQQKIKSTLNPNMLSKTSVFNSAAGADSVITATPCNEFTLLKEPRIAPTCKFDNTGSINIIQDQVSGGNKPYAFSIDNTNYMSNCFVSNLEEGHIVVFIKDKSGCITEMQFSVPSKKCNSSSQFNFSLADHKSWYIPTDKHDGFVLEVFSARGESVFKKDYPMTVVPSWDGKINATSYISKGDYNFRITYEDGVVEEGTIQVSE